jgi:hypothetical protein
MGVTRRNSHSGGKMGVLGVSIRAQILKDELPAIGLVARAGRVDSKQAVPDPEHTIAHPRQRSS